MEIKRRAGWCRTCCSVSPDYSSLFSSFKVTWQRLRVCVRNALRSLRYSSSHARRLRAVKKRRTGLLYCLCCVSPPRSGLGQTITWTISPTHLSFTKTFVSFDRFFSHCAIDANCAGCKLEFNLQVIKCWH